MRIFLAADPHGSQMTWEKMCRAPKVFKADVAMMCGDLTGKAIMPIIQEKEDKWYAQPHGKKKYFKKWRCKNNLRDLQQHPQLMLWRKLDNKLKLPRIKETEC